MSIAYFATDDNHGLSSGILAVDTGLFSEEDWAIVNAARPEELLFVIMSILSTRDAV